MKLFRYSIWRAGNTSPRVYRTRVTTDTNGAWTVNYASLGFTKPPIVQATCIGGTTAASVRNASLSAAPTTTSASGVATAPAVLSILGVLSVTLAPAGTVVHVTVTEDV